MEKEKYEGRKFKTIFISKEPPEDPLRSKLISWCRRFHHSGLAPGYEGGSYGNLSYRCRNGFIITPGSTFLDQVASDELVKVTDCDIEKRTVCAKGVKEPSSESFLHHMIYERRRDVNAIFHGHDDYITNNADELGLVVTEHWKPYGTIELAEEVMKKLDYNLIVMKEHGFLSLGKNMKEAGERAMEMKLRSGKAL